MQALYVTPRLACVKPAASVHPEPGSNSPSYMFLITYDVIVSQKNCPSSKTWVLTQFYAVNFNIFNELLVEMLESN